MGKSKNKRHRSKKPCPTGLPSVSEIEKEEDLAPINHANIGVENDDLQAIQTVTEQLQAVTVEDKECACITLSHLVEKDEAIISVILKQDIVKMVAPLLMDSSCVVRHAAAGTLRNLSVAGGPEVIDAMVDNDIMTPLVALINQFQQDWAPSQKNKNRVDTKAEIILESVHLLWNLCESNSLAVSIFNQKNLISIICRFLNREIYGNKLAIVAAHCLHTVTEENVEALEIINQPFIMEQIENFLQQQEESYDGILFKVLIAGIFLNTKNGRLFGCVSKIANCILDILSKTLSIDSNGMLENFSTQVTLCKRNMVEGEEETDDIDDAVSSLSSDATNVLTAQILALEILTNICCNDDMADNWDDVDSSDVSDEIVEDDEMEYEDLASLKFSGMLSSEIQEAVVSLKFMEKLVEKLKCLSDDTVNLLKENGNTGHSLLKRATTLQSRTLLCLHNLIPCLDIMELEGPSHLYSLWINIGQLAFKHTYVCPKNISNPVFCDSAEHTEFLDSVTSALRAILQKIIQVNTFKFEQLSWDDLQKLCELTELSVAPNVRKNIINTLGTIACHLVRSEMLPGHIIIKNVGLFLMELCAKDIELTVVAEALDAIFDIFGEDNTDAIAKEINLVTCLKQMSPSLIQKMNVQKKSLGQDYPVVMTARTNLQRFIKYKMSQKHVNGQ